MIYIVLSDVQVGAARSFVSLGNSPITGVTTGGIGAVVCENAVIY